MSRATHAVWSAVAAARERLLGPGHAIPGLRVLCYHSVGTEIPGDPYGLSVRPSDFSRQMEILASGRFGTPVSLGSARLDGSPEIAVSFDDGFLDTLTTAAPILADLRLPFSACATASFVRAGAAPHMTLGQLRELAKVPGAEIGAHGATHLRLAECDDEELAAELRVSKDALEQALGLPATVMTWPHGSASLRAAGFARRAGFTRAGCSLYGVNGPDRDRLLLRRTEVTGFDSESDFVRKCSGGFDWYALRQADPAAR